MPTVNTSVDVEIEVEVYCANCGAHLCNKTDSVITPGRRVNAFRVQACEVCIERNSKDSYEEGYETARKEFEKEEI